MHNRYDAPPPDVPAFPTPSELRELEAIATIRVRPLSPMRPIHGTRP